MTFSQTNRMLGYPDDARLLIINADDFGMYHAINAAILRALQQGVVRSTSLMVPCPLALHAIQLLKQNPDIPFAVHLTIIRDYAHWNWRPVTCGEKVPTLVDETGAFYLFDRMGELLARAKLDELEVEFRAQIDAVLAAGLKPTHLDWHALRFGARTDIFDLMLRLAREYGLAMRVIGQSYIEQVRNLGLPASDYMMLDSMSLPTDGKSARYAQLLRELPAGLSEWAVHPALGNEEAQAVDPALWAIRQADFEFVTSPEARAIIEREGIILLDYRPLQAVWQGKPPHG
ncbi:MAG: polysaccharide deacetylase family protein [Anaerolineae bacterium]